ncbi:hypothetical protein TGRUB_265510B, partial [Toxoplasma gondii RUB]
LDFLARGLSGVSAREAARRPVVSLLRRHLSFAHSSAVHCGGASDSNAAGMPIQWRRRRRERLERAVGCLAFLRGRSRPRHLRRRRRAAGRGGV